MSEEEAVEGTASVESGDDIWARTTAPQSAYTSRQVGFGFVVFGVLALVAFVLPLALA